MTAIDITARFIITVLFNGLWEAALFALVAWVVLRSMPSANATTRHAVLATALFAGLVLPIVTTVLTTIHTGTPAVSSRAGSPVIPSRSKGDGAPRRVAGASTQSAIPVASALSSASALPTVARLNLSLPRIAVVLIVGAWLLGALLVLARLAVSLVHLERLKRDALPLPIEYRTRLARWTDTGKGSRGVRLCRSDEIVIPIAVGLFDSMILVPERLLEELAPEDIDHILLHELAHLRRGDDWFNAVERVAHALLFFNPGVLWIVQQLDLEREVACDDWVLQQASALPYATCLAKVVETTIWPYRAMAAPGAFVTRRGMSIRIERLLAAHRDVGVRISAGPAIAAITVVGALCIAAAYVSPSIAYSAVPAATATASPVASASTASRPHVSGHVSRHVPASIAVPSTTVVNTHVHTGVRTSVDTNVSANVRANDSAHALSPLHARLAEHLASTVGSSDLQSKAVGTDYIDDLASVGYTNLTLDQLEEMRAVGVTADYIRDLANAGIVHPAIWDLVELRSLGVMPDYVHSMRAHFPSITVREIADLRAVGVDDAYIQALASAGFHDLTFRSVEDLRAVGVTPAYVQEMVDAGYPNLSAKDVEELRSMDIDAAYVKRAADHGFKNLTVEKLVELKSSDIL